jgi:hypothetical protein
VGGPAALPADLAELADKIVNPTDEPSRIIDLGQWLSLFYLLVDSAQRAGKGLEARRLTFQAAQCVEEALKFYGPEDESPPEGAFASAASRRAFAEHPERFARQRLRDIRGKLPDMRVMVRRLTRDAAAAEKPNPWWKFWRRRSG